VVAIGFRRACGPTEKKEEKERKKRDYTCLTFPAFKGERGEKIKINSCSLQKDQQQRGERKTEPGRADFEKPRKRKGKGNDSE